MRYLLLFFLLLTLSAKGQKLGIFFYDDCEKEYQDSLVQQLKAYYGIEVKLLSPEELSKVPKKYDGYNARKAMSEIDNLYAGKYDRIIGVMDWPLYLKRITGREEILHGVASPLGRAAVVTTYNFRRERIVSRTLKIVVHELSHTYGIWKHCKDSSCVMQPSITHLTIDDFPSQLCAACKSLLRKKIRYFIRHP